MANKFNLNNILKNAGSIMQQAQDELENTEVTGESGAGAVALKMNGKHRILELNISQEIMNEDKNIVEELIIAAFNSASSKVEDITKNKIMDTDNIFSAFGGDSDDADEGSK